MYFLTLPQHEQIYPEGLSVFAPFPLGWIKLAPKFTNFPAVTSFSRTFNKNSRTSKVRANPSYPVDREEAQKQRAYAKAGIWNPESGAGNGTGT